MQEESHLDVLFIVFSRVPFFNLKNVAVAHTDLMFLSSCFCFHQHKKIQTLCGSTGRFDTVYLSTASPLNLD